MEEIVVQSQGEDGKGGGSEGEDVRGVGGLGQGGWATGFTNILTHFNYGRESSAAYRYYG